MGCGIPLQNEKPDEAGYVTSIEQKYCQRCFKLIHYGDTRNYVHKSYNKALKGIYSEYKNALYILIVDCYEALILHKESFLELFKNNDVILVVNKIDLLPRNVEEERILQIYTGLFKKLHVLYPNVKDLLLTHYKDPSFETLFYESIQDYAYNKLVFVGKSNAGKSTIINKLLGNSDLTVSIYPGTTVGPLETECNGYTFVDTPGIDDEDNILVHLASEKLKKYLEYRTVKPLVYQLYEPQCYFFSKIFEIDVEPKGNASIIFESLRDDIHRTSLKNREKYLSRNDQEFRLLPWTRNEYSVKGQRTFLIKGFGLIRIKGNAKVIFGINDKINIYDCEVFI